MPEGVALKWFKRIALVLAAALALSQLVRPARTNPPVDETKTLHASGIATPQVEAIFDRSCSNCHSNRTVWPWYSNVAPVSWLLADHVKDARRELNFSEWNTFPAKRRARKLKEICEQVEERDMPLKSYLPLHRGAALSDQDRAEICAWAKQQAAALTHAGTATLNAPPQQR